MRRIDLSGRVFSRLTVVGISDLSTNRKLKWNCNCDCGSIVAVAGSNLANGHTRSCGCLMREAVSRRAVIRNTTHGQNTLSDRTGAHRTWTCMLQRVRDPSHISFERYGGAGVVVCERWSLFQNFFEDMGPRPKGMSIERINTNGNYEKSNCRWATRKEQQRNRRDNWWKWPDYSKVSI